MILLILICSILVYGLIAGIISGLLKSACDCEGDCDCECLLNGVSWGIWVPIFVIISPYFLGHFLMSKRKNKQKEEYYFCPECKKKLSKGFYR